MPLMLSDGLWRLSWSPVNGYDSSGGYYTTG